MDYIKLGNTGLDVSPICLGCMSFGDASKWTHEWVLGEEDSVEIIKRAIELGINFLTLPTFIPKVPAKNFLVVH